MEYQVENMITGVVNYDARSARKNQLSDRFRSLGHHQYRDKFGVVIDMGLRTGIGKLLMMAWSLVTIFGMPFMYILVMDRLRKKSFVTFNY